LNETRAVEAEIQAIQDDFEKINKENIEHDTQIKTVDKSTYDLMAQINKELCQVKL